VNVTVKLFAVARQLAGSDTLQVELPAAATVGQLRAELARVCPPLAPWLAKMRIAVDAEYAGDAAPVTATSDVACIPPVSGG
jgi:molybdopterin converting factor subunit 1